ncbi:(2Fe-2S)-binding protein [Caballeronia mineralivorans]|uniref:(2Fe-2S)-binding protein n=1 Tax=Caballeronia mineralivorans TaxID=2010198 RepID=UPI0009E597B3|nr:(2Fe-2S)-binding protein [Caballeronia mineralivorans]
MFRRLNDPDHYTPTLTLSVDGCAVQAESGDTVASVLLRLAPPLSRTTPVKGSPRAPYCLMGVCFDCLALVDNVASTQTCLVQVREGMRVERQHGRRTVTNVVTGEGQNVTLEKALHSITMGPSDEPKL